VGITSGVVGIRSKPKECISAGYTRVGLVTKNPKIVTTNKSDGVNYDFPLLASLNHYSATFKYSTCTTNVVTHCYRRFFEDRPLAIRTRSITSDGMTHLDPKLNGYDMKTAKNPDTSLNISVGEQVWALLQREFFINRYEAYQTSVFLFEQRMNILAENEKGRCIPGFPCNKHVNETLQSLMVTINRKNDPKSLSLGTNHPTV